MTPSLFKQTILLIVAFFIGNVAIAQNAPDWYDETSRGHNYPDNNYYTGLAYADVSSTEASAIQKAEQAAKAEALSKILMTVKSRSVSSSIGVQITSDNGIDEQIVEKYSSLTQIDVEFKDVPGLQCKQYRSGKTVTAFAYVKKKDLARYYDRKITSTLTKIETTLDNADELVKHGEKIKARSVAQSAVEYIAEVETAQRILLAVSNDVDIQSEESSALAKRLIALLVDLKNSTAIYLDCKAYAQNKPYRLFANDLKGVLSRLGCNFVNSREQADWVVSIETDVVRENQVNGAFFVWIDGAIAVRNNATSQVIYNEQISSIKDSPDGIKGGHTAGYAQASAKAYKEVTKIVGDKVYEIIKQ